MHNAPKDANPNPPPHPSPPEVKDEACALPLSVALMASAVTLEPMMEPCIPPPELL